MNDRLEIAATAYLAAYGALPTSSPRDQAWGLKCSSEDALLAVMSALYPASWSNAAEGIERIRASKSLSALVDCLDDEEQQGKDADEIALFLVPRIDCTMVDWARQ